jgi:hypothetical protein
MKKVFTMVFTLLILFSIPLYAKDLELIFHKKLLQNIVDKIFPLHISKSYESNIKISSMGGDISLGFKVDIYNPLISIKTNSIQMDASSKVSSFLGENTFPVKFKMAPVYNEKNNNIELKIIEGSINAENESVNNTLGLGSLDLSKYFTNIKVPLKLNNIEVQNKILKPKCKNIEFQYFKDKITMSGDVIIE